MSHGQQDHGAEASRLFLYYALVVQDHQDGFFIFAEEKVCFGQQAPSGFRTGALPSGLIDDQSEDSLVDSNHRELPSPLFWRGTMTCSLIHFRPTGVWASCNFTNALNPDKHFFRGNIQTKINKAHYKYIFF